MRLILRVVRYQDVPVTRDIRATCDELGCTIGRAEDNTLVLPDDQRIVSKHHAQIFFEAGAFYLRDISANGTFVNRAATAIPKDAPVRLNPGDDLRMGEYEMQVQLQSDPKADVASALPQQPQAAPPDPLDLLRGGATSQADLHAQPPELIGEATPRKPPLIPEDVDFLKPAGTAATPPERAVGMEHIPPESVVFEAPPGGTPKSPPGMTKEPPARTTPETTPAATDTALALDQALTAFLAGLGISNDELRITAQSAPAFLRHAGGLLREMTQGYKRILTTRTSLKSELRVEVTTIQATENNPLKFSVDVNDALAKLLLPDKPGYLPPLEAVREASDDIQAHQMAILAGMREALHTLVSRFDPSALEAHFSERSFIDSMVSGSRKARCWELFKELYEQTARDAENDFMHLLADEFAVAYETQIARLRNARSTATPRKLQGESS
jgi:type VI secretion system FHA domain protein